MREHRRGGAAERAPAVKALVLDPDPRLDLAFAEPERAPGEAIVEVRVAGVCDTDLQLARGYMGFSGVPGHEFVGVVTQSDDPSWGGKRVVGDINAGCGACPECLARGGHHCAKRTVLGILGRGGAFAERLTLPTRCLVEVPPTVPDDAAVFAEPLAAALHVLDEASAVDAPVIVLGDGKLGLLITRALLGDQRRVTLVGRHPTKLELAARVGATVVLEHEASGVERAGLVVDATGSAAGLALALRLTRPRGTVVLKTTLAGATSVDLSPVVIDELRVVGSRCGDLARAVLALARGAIDPRPLVEARYPLDRAVRAFEHAGRRGVLKVLVDVS